MLMRRRRQILVAQRVSDGCFTVRLRLDHQADANSVRLRRPR